MKGGETNLLDSNKLRAALGAHGRLFVKQFDAEPIWNKWETLLLEKAKQKPVTRKQKPAAEPVVSVIIPVYNVAPYLRQCLDSVVNQTLYEIQILCVNDGSTDGSREILQEYADHDARMTILDQPNRGAGAARNAALPHIKGLYTYFADPDDWLEPDLCEKTVRRIEETSAEIVYIRYFNEADAGQELSGAFHKDLPEVRVDSRHRKHFLLMMNSPWMKLYRTEFLLKNDIRCSEMTPYEDVMMNWKACVLAEKIAVLDEALYHYRLLRPGSAGAERRWNHATIFGISDEIGTELKQLGKYSEYREAFLQQRLANFFGRYVNNMTERDKPVYLSLVQGSLTCEDREFLLSETVLDDSIREFYARIIA